MKIVIDASSAFVMLANPERGGHIVKDATVILAPELIVAELLNARWKSVRSRLEAPSLDNVLGLLDRVTIVATLPYARDAAALAQSLNHPVYDCLYAVLARRENAHLVTADRRFAGKLGNETPNVVIV